MMKAKKYLLLMGIALIWGSQFLLNHWVLAVFSPTALALGRAGVGALILNLGLFLIKEPKAFSKKISLQRYWIMIQWIAFLEATFPFLLISWGQKSVPSSVTAVIMASIALFTVIWILLFVKEERVSFSRMLSLGVGFSGVVILFLPQLLRAHHDLEGEFAILVGALCFSLSMILIRKLGFVRGPIRMARDILSCAALQLLIWALIWHQPLWYSDLTSKSILSLLALGIFAGGVVYVLYVKLINHAGAGFTGLVNYLVPVVGVLLGVGVLGEHLSWNIILALILLIGAMIWV